MAEQRRSNSTQLKAGQRLSPILTRSLVGLTWLMSSAFLPGIAQTTSPAPMAMEHPVSTDTGYVLGVGDRIRMDLFNVPEYSGEFEVLVDGAIHIPVVGAVSVSGLTLERASLVLAERMLQVARRPIVTLSLVQARPITVAIAGEINRPGSYTLDQISGAPTLTQALQQAGGITQSADVRQIQIRRVQSAGSSQTMTVDLWELVQDGNLSQDLALRDGDRIVIPTATSMDLEVARRLANTSFAATRTTPLPVAIVGEVNRPGPYTLTPNQESSVGAENQILTVTQAIQAAGGITQSADIRRIEVHRTSYTGEEQVIAVDFWQLLQSGDLSQDLPLQSGDTIVIPTAIALTPDEMTELAATSFSPAEMTVNVVGEVTEPGAVQVPPNTPLNQAILAAGGFNNRAQQGSVELIRLNPDGTVARQEIEVDFAEGLGSENNPALRPNDTIIVGRSGLAGISDGLGLLLSPVSGVFSLLQLLGL